MCFKNLFLGLGLNKVRFFQIKNSALIPPPFSSIKSDVSDLYTQR